MTAPYRYACGADVSNLQGTINWSLFGRCVEFVHVKRSEGTNFPDGFFDANWQGAQDHGLVRHAYHFGRPFNNTGADEARYCISLLKDKIGVDDGIDLDLENDGDDSNEQRHADLLAYVVNFKDTIRAEFGFVPMLYSRVEYMQRHNLVNHRAEIGDMGLWLAQYNTVATVVPDGWDFWAVRQYSSQGTVLGVNGLIDLDLFNGPVEQLRKYGRQAA